MDRIERGFVSTLVMASDVDDLGTIMRIGEDYLNYQEEKKNG